MPVHVRGRGPPTRRTQVIAFRASRPRRPVVQWLAQHGPRALDIVACLIEDAEYAIHIERSGAQMAGNLGFDELKGAVKAGSIDTVLVAMVDMQGRLVGKRFQAEYFVDGAHEETHACDYLLANDIDMEP